VSKTYKSALMVLYNLCQDEEAIEMVKDAITTIWEAAQADKAAELNRAFGTEES